MIKPIQIPDLEELAKGLIATSFFTECNLPGTFKPIAFLHNWKGIMANNLGVMWGYYHKGKVVGILGGLLTPDLMSGEMVATEAFWYVLPKHRKSIWSVKLLFTFELWAKQIGAKRIIMAHLLHAVSAKLSHYYVKRGYRAVEINYVKDL